MAFNSEATLISVFTQDMAFQFNKHGGTFEGQTKDDYIEQQVNWMSNHQFLERLSEAMEELLQK